MQRTSKSLELLKQKIEQYRKVFDALFSGERGQHEIVKQVFVALGLPPTEQEIATEGMESTPARVQTVSNSIERAGKVLQKMCQIHLISNQAVVETCCESLDKRTRYAESNYFEFTLIREALYRESNFKHQVVTTLHQKPPQRAEEEAKEQVSKMDVDAVGPENERPLSFEDYEALYARAIQAEGDLFTLAI